MTDALFTVDTAARRIRGLLLPFGELSSPNISGTEPVMFSAGTVTLPADPSIVTLNEAHDQLEPRGRAVHLEETTAGIVAEFEIARTPEGDALLEAAQRTPRPRLSAELRGIVRRGAAAVTSALRGAAVVPQGAFESAALFAALDPIEERHTVERYTDADGRVWQLATDQTTTVDDDGTRTTATTVVESTEDPDEAPAEPATPAADEADPIEEEDMTAAAATIPAGLTRPAAPKDTTTADGLFAAVAGVKSGNVDAVQAYAGGDALFAIATVQHAGPSGVTIGADTQTPAYLGELVKRQPYTRRFVPLLAHDTLTSFKVYGWQWDEGKEPTVGDYTGNTAEVPSNAVDTVQISADAQRIAGAHKLDRRFADFGDQSVIASYFKHQTEDVLRKTDAKALAAIISAAPATTPGSVPSGVAKGLAAIVDGALDVLDTENNPGYALVDKALWREIVMTGKDDVLAFLTMSLGLAEGDLEGFKIRPATIGTAANAGKQVVVGAKEAITFYELGGDAPIRVEGIDPHHGAFDPAVFAYWATLTNNAKAVRIVTTA